MRLRVLVMLIVVYVLAAFGWLTYSLLNYSDSDYTLKNDVLKAGLNTCILQVVQGARKGELGADSSGQYYLRALRIDVEPTTLERFVREQFNGNYVVRLLPREDRTLIDIDISADRLEALATERYRQKRIWLFQSILLFVLVGSGLFGVFYSINSLYQLGRQQNNFLLSVTHEFKTPIAAIRLLLQTAQNPRIAQEKKDELIQKGIHNTYRLEELADNMLTATQMEFGNYAYKRQEFDLSELIERIASNHRVKGEIRTDILPGVRVYGDPFTLRIAISNLVANALKYSDDAPIDLVLTEEPGKVKISVKDQGIGIPKGLHKKIFTKFFRAEDEETRTTKGTGLGLFIAKAAVDAHKGSISVRANLPKGSIFTMELPSVS